MAVPTYDRFIEPILRYLASHPDGAAARDVHDAAANALGLSEADSRGTPAKWRSTGIQEPSWLGARPAQTGGVVDESSPRVLATGGFGPTFARDQPTPVPENVLEALATEYNDVRLRPAAATPDAPTVQTTVADRATVSPVHRLEQALSGLRQGVVAELLDVLSQVSPEYFETVVLDLLHKMGYGTSPPTFCASAGQVTAASTG